jgi:hypothetical protein
MDAAGYTIRIFVPDGDPEGVRVIDRMNWTGSALAFPRDRWLQVRQRKEFDRVGVYMLIGRDESDEDLPRVYIGEGDGLRERIEKHYKAKEFWDWGICFSSNSNGLNKSHVQMLEYALVRRAREVKQCILDNVKDPEKPTLSEHEEADVEAFLREMLRIIPLVGLRAFEKPRPIVAAGGETAAKPAIAKPVNDTIVVPAQEDGFQKVFIGENAWYAIRIARSMLDNIKYIAAYQTSPISAVTHFASVKQIEPYGDNGKYKLVFAEPAKAVGPIPFGQATTGSMQGTRYTTLAKLQTAKGVVDLF